MPSKNSVKTYAPNAFYHIYNRGVEKRNIFQDQQDYRVFLKYLKEYLSPPPNRKKLMQTFTLQGQTFQGIPRQVKNYTNEIDLLAYCLMPNHFHWLVYQYPKNAIQRFTQSMLTRYSMYFNKKYKRVGSLFQGKYKAAMITDETYLLHLSRYIHLNPQKYGVSITKAYSSYGDFIGLRKTVWVKPDLILDYFKKGAAPGVKSNNSYQRFVEEGREDDQKILGGLTLELEPLL